MPVQHFDYIDERDLSDVPRLRKTRPSVGLFAGGVLLAVLFVGLLVYGSLPELSPEEIVAMDGYQGEQPTRHIFNLDSLRAEAEAPPESGVKTEKAVATAVQEDSSVSEVTEVAEPVSDVLPAADADSTSAEPVQISPEIPVEIASQDLEQKVLPNATTEIVPSVTTPAAEIEEPVLETVETVVSIEPQEADNSASSDSAESVPQVLPTADARTDSSPDNSSVTGLPVPDEPSVLSIADTEVVSPPVETTAVASETPATTVFSTARKKKVVSATATTPTIQEAADTVVIASVAAPEPVPIAISTSTLPRAAVSTDTSRPLPLRSVRVDATEVKSSPSAQSETVLSLDRGEIVTAFEQQGEWVHVGTNDESAITGFVLESSLQSVDTKPSG